MSENESRLTKRNPDGSVGINDFRYYNYADFQKLANKLAKFEDIGTIEEFKALKEKNTPMELAEHNFQDEPHHYLCPSCRNIVSCNQNYCEECGQALEN